MDSPQRNILKSFQPTALHIHVVGAISTLALAAAGYALSYAPAAQARERSMLQAQAINRAQSESTATAEHLRRAREKLEALRDEFGESLRRGADPEVMIRASASSAMLSVHSLATGQRTEADSLQRTTLVMHASGSFSDINDWLAAVHTELPGVVVEGFSISTTDAPQPTIAFQASLSVYAPQTAPSAKDDVDRPTGAQEAPVPDR